jgi:hypothetical protein
MIIRLTLSDNDFTHYIEEFCLGLRDRMFNYEYIPSFSEPMVETYKGDVETYSQDWISYLERRKAYQNKRAKLMNPDNRYKKGTKEYKEICDEVRRLWKMFTEKNVGYIADEVPKVSIQHSLEEGWENGEVVYYFTPYDKYITK